MKASELIKELENAIKEHGDLEVMHYSCYEGTYSFDIDRKITVEKEDGKEVLMISGEEQ